VLAASAFAHVKRTTYSPNPAPETSATPAAGGTVPKVRSLASALKKPVGQTRVMCKKVSMKRVRRRGDLPSARRLGVSLSPTRYHSPEPSAYSRW
jgi:hypothetical protein